MNIILRFLALLIAFLICSCATTGDPATQARIKSVATTASQVAWKFILDAGQGYVSKEIGAEASATIFDEIRKLTTPEAMQAKLSPISDSLATAAATAFAQASPQTAAEKSAAANSIAAALQAGAYGGVGIFKKAP